MSPCGVITLLTDFGLSDPFVGLLHGVVLSRFPAARVVDLCHGVAPQDVRQGAFFIERCHGYFPPGSVHVVVVDPGVGTDRLPLALELEDHVFVAPDNGVLGGLLARPGAAAHQIDVGHLGLREPSRTFHGRDVFAPVAAELAAGRLKVSDLGPKVSPVVLVAARPERDSQRVLGCVVATDRFGNLISNIEADDVRRFERPVVEVSDREAPLAGTYAEVPAGELVALVSSFDTLEIAVREGSAARLLGVASGARVLLREASSRRS